MKIKYLAIAFGAVAVMNVGVYKNEQSCREALPQKLEEMGLQDQGYWEGSWGPFGMGDRYHIRVGEAEAEELKGMICVVPRTFGQGAMNTQASPSIAALENI